METALKSGGFAASELQQAIERHIIQKTWGRVYRLQVDVLPDRIVIHGRTATYYAKQLALEAALEALCSTDVTGVELDIHVGTPSAFSNRIVPFLNNTCS
jgi:hypothetical protein